MLIRCLIIRCDFFITNSRKIISTSGDGIHVGRHYDDVKDHAYFVRIINVYFATGSGLGVAKSTITIDSTACIHIDK